MLLLKKICSIALVLKLVYILWKQDVLWTHIILMNVQFMSYVQGDCCKKNQNNVVGKSQDYNQKNNITSRKTSIRWRLVDGSPWQKGSTLLQLYTRDQSTAGTDYSTTYYKNYYSNMIYYYSKSSYHLVLATFWLLLFLLTGLLRL